MHTGANLFTVLACTFLLCKLSFVVADFDCLCNYANEVTVYSDADLDSAVLGYMYEFDCKPLYATGDGTTTTFVAIQVQQKVGYVQRSSQEVESSCLGSIDPLDAVHSATAQTPLVTSELTTSSTKPTTASSTQATSRPTTKPTSETTSVPRTTSQAASTQTPTTTQRLETTRNPVTTQTRSTATTPIVKSSFPSTAAPSTSNPSTEPSTSKPSTEPSTSKPSTEPSTSKPSTEPSTTKPSTSRATSTTKPSTTKSTSTVPSTSTAKTTTKTSPTSTPSTASSSTTTAKQTTTPSTTVATTTTSPTTSATVAPTKPTPRPLSPIPTTARPLPPVITTPRPLPPVITTPRPLPLVVTTPRPLPPSSGCDNGWLLYDQSCYYVYTVEAVKWVQAKALCRLDGAHLVTIESPAESDFITRMLQSSTIISSSSMIWTAGTDRHSEGSWEWEIPLEDSVPYTSTSKSTLTEEGGVAHLIAKRSHDTDDSSNGNGNGHSTASVVTLSLGNVNEFSNWADGQPEHAAGQAKHEDCLCLIPSQNFMWGDCTCTYELFYMCEKQRKNR